VSIRQQFAEEFVGLLLGLGRIGRVGECGLLCEVGDGHVAHALRVRDLLAVLQITGDKAALGGSRRLERSRHVSSSKRRAVRDADWFRLSRVLGDRLGRRYIERRWLARRFVLRGRDCVAIVGVGGLLRRFYWRGEISLLFGRRRWGLGS